jgi:hypothetical protein
MLPILALLASAAGPFLLTDEVVSVPASQWRSIEVGLRQRPAVVECQFETAGEHPGVRAILMSESDAARMQGGRAHSILASTAYQSKGRFRVAVTQPGGYLIVLDNRLEGRRAAHVRVKVFLEFMTAKAAPARYPKRWRQWLSIGLSFSVFFGVLLLAGWRLKRAFYCRRTPPPPEPSA